MVDLVWTVSHHDIVGAERCQMVRRDGGWLLTGLVVAMYESAPLDVGYEVGVDDDWTTRSVSVVLNRLARPIALRLDRDPEGTWTIDGVAAPALRGCVDVDLGITPATNTLPIRRLDLPVGADSEIEVAWVRFPDLRVERGRQTYSRVADDVWRYASGGFAAELTVDSDGLVVRYGDDLWRRVVTDP